VRIAIWDSGSDITLFPHQLYTDPKPQGFDPHGLAFDLLGNQTHGYLYPLTPEERAAFPSVANFLEGFSDLQESIDSPAADAAKKQMTALTPADTPAFFDVCPSLAELSPARPFYPARGVAGMTRLAHAAALGLGDAAGLCRACDRATAERPAGAPLFWTLGANQSGKAAIAAWRDLLLPALHAADPPALWPFAGDLHALLLRHRIVIAETYPAEALRHLGLRMNGSKRRQSDRAALADGLRGAMARLAAEPTAAMQVALADGFGADAAGEDRFDSLLGLLCVLNVLAGNRPDGAPDDPWIRRWEGWVLGQTALPAPGWTAL